ncbi:helix-turn-helix transcriptional regulator [Streptomyces griseorubiginosus]|uniref:helix-turn-helix transcriptional regulator n=1 Tax=Streptomyces griseorubiginosus TaxID=67304 RepID=UPI00362D3A62
MLCLDMTKVLEKARSKGVDDIPALAAIIGINEVTLYRLNGRYMEPSLITVWKLAKYLGQPIEWFVYDDPKATRRASVPRQRKATSASRRRRAST